MSGSHAKGSSGRRLAIVLLLVGVLSLLHHFTAVGPTGAPSTLLAFGFVVLASYAVGQLVEVIKLPHITGYLLAGVVLGPSFAALLPPALQVAPFDRGVLSADVIAGLSVLDALAVALIALTAGGELKLDVLRKGGRSIAGVLGGQGLVVLTVVAALGTAMAGAVGWATLPGMPEIPLPAAMGLGCAVAAIAYATSPAATIAVVNDTGAEGPLTRTILSTVVLKDVLVVILFSVATAYAAGALGLSSGEGSLARELLLEVGGSVVLGAGLGFGVAQYLRWVNKEVLLFLVAVVYAATLSARALGLDPVLVFIATGFAASNFSEEADKLLENVERLSLPVYVVFFTLAGARLHLDHLAHVAPYAAALFLARAGAFWVGTRVGARVGGAGAVVERYGWMGYLSQAGVAISLTGALGAGFGEAGRALETLVISTIALNELFGPVLLKVGLSLAGEVSSSRAGAGEGVVAAAASHSREMPALPAADDPWGPPLSSGAPILDAAARDLRAGLAELVERVDATVLAPLAEDADAYWAELRQELLRSHRRASVQLRTEADSNLPRLLHLDRVELLERWRAVVAGRAGRIAARHLDLSALPEGLDRLVDEAPERAVAPVAEAAHVARASDGPWRSLRRAGLRARARLARAAGSEPPRREVPVRGLALFHLGGPALARAEGLASALVNSEWELAARTHALADLAVREFVAVAAAVAEPAAGEGDPLRGAEALRRGLVALESELSLARQESAAARVHQRERLARILGGALRSVEDDLVRVDTPDLSLRQRRTTRVFAQRVAALEVLGPRLGRAEQAVAGRLWALALELELLALEARVGDLVAARAEELRREVRGRSALQLDRVHAALEAALAEVEATLAAPPMTGEALATALRAHTEALEAVAGDAARSAAGLRDQLRDESSTTALVDALRRAVRELSETYAVPSAPLVRGEWKLPPPVPLTALRFRELVSSQVEAVIAPRLVALTRDLSERVQPVLAALQELERLVAFDNELARAELEVVREGPVPEHTRLLLRDTFVGALSRARDALDRQREEVVQWPAALAEAMHEAVLGSLRELHGKVIDAGDELRALAPAPLRPRWLVASARDLPSRMERALELARGTLEGAIGGEALGHWRAELGLPARVLEPDRARRALAPPRAAADLPVFYTRLLSADTLEAADAVGSRQQLVERARHTLGARGPGLRTVALVGLDGVGKGTLSAAVVRAAGSKQVRKHVLSGPVGAAELAALFADRAEGHMMVVSGFHWLVSSRARDFAVLRGFVERVLAERGRAAVLVHADRLVWDYACTLAPLADAFAEVIELPALDEVELEAAVLARHALSGYRADFSRVAGHAGLAQLVGPEASRARRPAAAYFRALHAASGGLVRDALRLWLASIHHVDEGAGVVHVGALPPSALPALRALPRETVSALYQTARQGWIDADTLEGGVGTTRAEAEARLERWVRAGLLDREKAAYRIPLHLRGSVHRLLVERGWV